MAPDCKITRHPLDGGVAMATYCDLGSAHAAPLATIDGGYDGNLCQEPVYTRLQQGATPGYGARDHDSSAIKVISKPRHWGHQGLLRMTET